MAEHILPLLPDLAGELWARIASPSRLAHVSARGIFIIEADDPVIGVMAFAAVGMGGGVYRVDRIVGVRPTSMPFTPRFVVEF